MTRMMGADFKRLYMGLFDILSHSSERPSSDRLKSLYSGVGGVPGFSRFSLETFSELVGLAQQECKFMPTPSWFTQRAQDLPERAESLPSLPGVFEIGDPGRVVQAFNEGVADFKRKVAFQRIQADELIGRSNGKESVDSDFKAWVEANQYPLARDFPDTLSKAGGNQLRLVNLLIHRSAVRLRYIQRLEEPDTALDSYLEELRKRQGVLVRQ